VTVPCFRRSSKTLSDCVFFSVLNQSIKKR